ncbi:hypothetical protein [Natranaerobius thermophilus]|uniref:Uncharacterized protein n=1 Tax=Natranaerobius thermophilus (strain ATCC BAA-1301 / DSM 18059 / JW/NM-WN-LF) TaxID=457570 RepID=B2A4U3_NATTJ|nr:hypothetical protein [Natranaerobius thermophilus]ACB83865.1 hypothetical protein Nther_0267 [Natranaerobius thermophilus JW/NM-WN-LF]
MDIRLIILLLGVLSGGSLIIFEKIKGKKLISRDRWELYSSIFFTVLMFISSIKSFFESGALISLVFVGFFIAGIIMVVKAKQKL